MLLKGTVFRNLNYNNTRLYKFNDKKKKKSTNFRIPSELGQKDKLKIISKIKIKNKKDY